MDLVLHDADGKEITRENEKDREPILTFKPAETQTYYVAVYAAELSGDADAAGVAMAVTYR